MEKLSDSAFENAKQAADLLNGALKPLKILTSVAWAQEEKERFLKTGRLPQPEYVPIDTSASFEAVRAARKLIDGDHPVFDWLKRVAGVAADTARMIDHRGTEIFSHFSQTLYGIPTEYLLDKKTRVIDLARHLDGTLQGLDVERLVVQGYEQFTDAETFAQKLRPKLAEHFGEAAPKVVVSEDLAAKAAASSVRIRVNARARFSDRDVWQLLQHEALIHTATSLNGKSQAVFPLLSRSHAGTTEIQEGLAVFAEIISGALDPVRFRRLADRVIAIQMSLEGADFKEVFDFYRERSADDEAAFENTRRIFRGGLIKGGAPFTKDMVYLNGLLRVHNFMRTVVSIGRADLIRLLFVGKMDLEDVPALAALTGAGYIQAPKYLPPWAKDLRFLVAYLAYSSFLNQVKMPGFQAYYSEYLADTPVIWDEMG